MGYKGITVKLNNRGLSDRAIPCSHRREAAALAWESFGGEESVEQGWGGDSSAWPWDAVWDKLFDPHDHPLGGVLLSHFSHAKTPPSGW